MVTDRLAECAVQGVAWQPANALYVVSMSTLGRGLGLVVMVFLTLGCGETGHSRNEGTNTNGASTGETTTGADTHVPTGTTGTATSSTQPTDEAPSASTNSNMSRSDEDTSENSSSEAQTYSCEGTCSRSVGCPSDTTESAKECVELCKLYEGLCPSESAALGACGAELDDAHFGCDAEGKTAIADGSCMKEGDQLVACILASSMN